VRVSRWEIEYKEEIIINRVGIKYNKTIKKTKVKTYFNKILTLSDESMGSEKD